MRNILKSWFLIFVVFSACSTFNAPGNNSEGDQSIAEAPVSLSFEGDIGSSAQYRTVIFRNRSENNYEVTNLAFVGNDCGDFSVYNVLDNSGNILYQPGDTIDFSVASGSSVSVNLRFEPHICGTSPYNTTLIIFFDDNQTSRTASVAMTANVEQNFGTTACADDTNTYNDDLGDPFVSRTLQPAGIYYLRVDRIRSYIQPTGAFTTYAIQVGTDIKLNEVEDENEFQPIYLKLMTDEAGRLTLDTITNCSGFRLPTPITDQYMRGSIAVLTTSGPQSGSVQGTDSEFPGRIEFPSFKASLYAGITGSSLIKNDSNEFQIAIDVVFTTGYSESNSYLDDAAQLTDDDGDEFLNVQLNGQESTLVGSDVRHGAVTLVGVGTVYDDGNFKGSGIAQQAMLENDTYLFIEIKGYITTLKSGRDL